MESMTVEITVWDGATILAVMHAIERDSRVVAVHRIDQ